MSQPDNIIITAPLLPKCTRDAAAVVAAALAAAVLAVAVAAAVATDVVVIGNYTYLIT